MQIRLMNRTVLRLFDHVGLMQIRPDDRLPVAQADLGFRGQFQPSDGQGGRAMDLQRAVQQAEIVPGSAPQ